MMPVVVVGTEVEEGTEVLEKKYRSELWSLEWGDTGWNSPVGSRFLHCLDSLA